MLAPHLAWRFLREGRTQSLLILAGVTIGVAAFVFVSAIVAGLQANLLDKTLGTQAHIVVAQEEPEPRPLMVSDDVVFARRIEAAEPRRRPFDQWQRAAYLVALQMPDQMPACLFGPGLRGPRPELLRSAFTQVAGTGRDQGCDAFRRGVFGDGHQRDVARDSATSPRSIVDATTAATTA